MRHYVLALVALGLVVGCSEAAPDARRPPATGAPSSIAAAELAAPVDPSTPTGWGPTEGELAEARDIVGRMSVEEQAWQVLMPSFWGTRAEVVPPAEARRNQRSHASGTIADALGARPYGGLFVNSQSVEDATQVERLVSALHDTGDRPDGLPLLVSVDQEGGVVQRIKEGVTRVPSARSVGATGDLRLARRVARNNGRELRALGFTMVFAPVADVDTAGNGLVASRSYSSDYRKAAAMVTASTRGYLDAGIIPVIKHFPGHGGVRGDSHRVLPVQTKPLPAMLKSDLLPFRAAIEAGAPAVMTGHIAVAAQDRDLPASLSPAMVQGVLREQLGFAGLVVTDSQGMAPVYARYGSGEGAVRSLAAGNDLVLNSPHVGRAHKAVVAAVRSGQLPAVRLADAATKVAAIRLLQERIGGERPDLSVLRSSKHLADAARAGAGG